jgi:hypothetical protein
MMMVVVVVMMMITITGHARSMSFSAQMAAAFPSPGSVILNMTVLMDLMKSTAVSLIDPFNFIS